MKGKQYDTTNVHVKFVLYPGEVYVIEYDGEEWKLQQKIKIAQQNHPIVVTNQYDVFDYYCDNCNELNEMIKHDFHTELSQEIIDELDKLVVMVKLII